MVEVKELQGWGKDHHRLVMDEMKLKGKYFLSGPKQVELAVDLIL